jgi:hypothetical protein
MLLFCQTIYINFNVKARKVFDSVFGHFFYRIMSGSVLLHRQHSPEDVQQLLAWYKIRDTLLGQNYREEDIKKALDLAAG